MKKFLIILFLIPFAANSQQTMLDSVVIPLGNGQFIRYTIPIPYTTTVSSTDSLRLRNTATKKIGLLSQYDLPISNATVAALGLKANISALPSFINLASAFSSTSVTRVNVTGWSFAVTSGKTYRIEIIADYQTAALTTGGSIGVLLSGGATGTVRGNATGAISQAAVATGLSIPIRTLTGTGSFLTTSGVSVINSPHDISMTITFTCTASGTFSVQWASEVAASASQLNQNSSLIYQALN